MVWSLCARCSIETRSPTVRTGEVGSPRADGYNQLVQPRSMVV